MKHSTFRQPLPADLAPLMSKGYELASGEPQEFEIVGPAPAGSLSSPGEDMAHFMIAHLQNGEYNGNRILSAETAEKMHNSPLTMLPPLNRMELGFFETNINGREVIAHLGDTRVFPHLAAFVPEGERRLLRVVQQPGQGGRGRQPARRAVRGLRRSLFPGRRAVTTRVDAKTAAEHAAHAEGQLGEFARLAIEFLAR